jgi:hypothetical protein
MHLLFTCQVGLDLFIIVDGLLSGSHAPFYCCSLSTFVSLVAMSVDEANPKMAEAQAAIIQRVEDLQLTDMCDQDLVVIWEELAHVHLSYSLAMHLAF